MADPSSDKPPVLRETDEEARRLARTLLRAARFGALAVIDPQTGYPFASRVLTGTDIDGVPVVLVSALSTHTRGLAEGGRASLLVGEPGRGDPLAHPRMTVRCRAARIDRDTADNAGVHARIRDRFMRRHPKAALYVDFPDFVFFRLEPEAASLNGGFGKAYALAGEDLIIASPATGALAEMEAGAIDHMNSDHADAIGLYATAFAGARDASGWVITGIDAAGLDLRAGDALKRIEFDAPLKEAQRLRAVLVDLAGRARRQKQGTDGR